MLSTEKRACLRRGQPRTARVPTRWHTRRVQATHRDIETTRRRCRIDPRLDEDVRHTRLRTHCGFVLAVATNKLHDHVHILCTSTKHRSLTRGVHACKQTVLLYRAVQQVLRVHRGDSWLEVAGICSAGDGHNVS